MPLLAEAAARDALFCKAPPLAQITSTVRLGGSSSMSPIRQRSEVDVVVGGGASRRLLPMFTDPRDVQAQAIRSAALGDGNPQQPDRAFLGGVGSSAARISRLRRLL